MRRIGLCVITCGLAIAAVPRAEQSPLAAASAALGADGVYSLRIAASGSNFTVGQAYITGSEWPRVIVKSYTAWVNYDTGISRVDMVREMPNPIPAGGGVAFAGEQTQNLFYSGRYAWNGFPPAPPLPAADAGRAGGAAPAAGGAAPGARAGGAAQGAQAAAPAVPAGPGPQSEAVVLERKLWVWSTPHGFLKAAALPANKATTRAVAGGTEVSLTLDGRLKLEGLIDAANQVTRVRTWIPNTVMGDMLVETLYSDYRDFSGVRFPARIVQRQGGQVALDLTVSGVERNPNVSFVIPGSVYMAPTTAAPVAVTVQEVAPGVSYLTGGGAHSVAIALRDHVVVVDLPTTFERGAAVLAKAKELNPGKPVRFVINTHAHFDHSSGLRAAVAEGATILTHQSNRAFLQSALSAPRTLLPDPAGTKAARVQGAGARHELSDGARRVQLHQILNNRHAVGWLAVYLPNEKILIQADGFTPAAAGAPIPTTPSPTAQALADNVTRLKLDVERILSLHGPRVATMAELTTVANVGRAPAPTAR